MADKEYIKRTSLRTARPRSERLRRLGAAVSGGSSVVQSQSGLAAGASAGDGHTHPNLPYLNQITTDNDGYEYLTQSREDADGNVSETTEKVKAGYADDAAHASEADHSADADTWKKHEFDDWMDQSVRTKDTVRFAKVIFGLLQTPDFLSGIETGAGAAIDENGNGEMNSLILRSFLKVPELIYNKIRITGGEMWNTEGGTVASVEKDPDSDTAYTLALEVEDGDTIDLAVDDICKGHYNSGGTFISSYFRVTAVDQSARTVRIVLGADSEVPGGENHAPVPYMHVARYGSFTDTERQRSQYFSSSEMRIAMLDGVDQYIILPKHYKTVWGNVPDSLVPSNIPLKGKASMYLDSVLARNFIQLDASGSVVKTIRDRGLWDASVTDYLCDDEWQDEVWHLSCKWRCIVEGTTAEPKWDSTDWLLVAGDSSLSLDIESSDGDTFLCGELETTLTAVVRRGVNDITSSILDSDFTWSRDTGDTAEDSAWNTSHAGSGKSVALTNEDLPTTHRKGRFVCTAYVRDGAETLTAEVAI